MHEMSIVVSLMEQLERIAAEQGLVQIAAVEVVCGELKQVVPEAFIAAFEAVTEGTVAHGASLELVEEPMRALCGACETRYEPAIDDFQCPHCGAAEPEIIAGGDIVLRSVVGDVREQT